MSLFKFGFTSTASKEGATKVKKDGGKTDVCRVGLGLQKV